MVPYDVPIAVGRDYIDLAPDIVAAILITLNEGWRWATKSKHFRMNDGEVEITEQLRDGMRQVLKKKKFPWSQGMVVLPGTESRSLPSQFRPDGRTDIPILLLETFQTSGEHDPHLIIECKRVDAQDASLCRQYVVEGIDRFSTGKYGSNHAVGIMAGYLTEGTGKQAVLKINSYLTGKSRKNEHLKESKWLAFLTWKSLHLRPGLSKTVQIYHAFLGYEAKLIPSEN